jgi:hypothetical protein
MAKIASELPIDRYNREIRELWAKARNMSSLTLPELIETLAAFAAQVVGVSYNPKHHKESDSEYSNQEGNRMLFRLKQELASRYQALTKNSEHSLVSG